MSDAEAILGAVILTVVTFLMLWAAFFLVTERISSRVVDKVLERLKEDEE